MLNDVATRETLDLTNLLFKPNSNSQGNSHNGFDQFMADMENRSRDMVAEPRERERERERDHNRGERPSTEHIRGERPPGLRERQREPHQADAEQAEQLCEVIEPENAIADNYYVQEAPVDEETREAIIEIIAEAIYYPPGVVIDLMAVAEVYPEELAEPQAANKYLQAVLKVEQPVELLTIPEYQDALKQLTEAVVEVIETATPAEAKPALDKLKGLIATVDESDKMVVTMEEEVAEIKPVLEDDLSQMLGKNDRQDNPRSTETTQMAQVVTHDTAAPIVPEAPEVLLTEAPTVDVSPQANPAAVLAAQAAAINNVAEVAAQTRVDPTQVMQQIMARVKTVSAEGFAELRINLRPESLGDVSLRIAVQNGVVMAMFVAESQRIKEIIESNFNMLKDALEEQGIEVADLFVSVEGGDSQEQEYQFLKAQQEALRRLQKAAGLVADTEEEEAKTTIKLDNTVEFTA